MTEFEGQVLADLSVLKNQMNSLFGVGQPGRLMKLEEAWKDTNKACSA